MRHLTAALAGTRLLAEAEGQRNLREVRAAQERRRRKLAQRLRYRGRRGEARKEAVMSSGGGSAPEDPKV